MSQKLPINSFKSVENTYKLNKDFIKNYNEESNERNFLEVYFHYSKKLHDLHKDLTFLPEIMKTYSQLA